MLQKYQKLPLNYLPIAATLCQPELQIEKTSLDSQAVSVMTDFDQDTAITITAAETLSDAEQQMKFQGVKFLFVTDNDNYIIGVVSYDDISGEHIEQVKLETGLALTELCIIDVMKSVDDIVTLSMNDVFSSKVGDILLTLETKKHLLVLEQNEGIKKIRGLFSISQINKQLDFSF